MEDKITGRKEFKVMWDSVIFFNKEESCFPCVITWSLKRRRVSEEKTIKATHIILDYIFLSLHVLGGINLIQ